MQKKRKVYLFLCFGIVFLLQAGGIGWSQTTERVSVDSAGVEGNGGSGVMSSMPTISSDGRYVAFHSTADNLVASDTNGFRDIFVHDRQTGATTRVSVDSNGVEGNADCYWPSISSDGRYVAFQSTADNLVANDTNGTDDVFVHDRQTGETTRVSVDSNGVEGNNAGNFPCISPDGGYVTFSSAADNLVANDTNGTFDVFVHDRQTGETTRVSVDSFGIEGNGNSNLPIISSDGRYIAFMSIADNLVANDTNAEEDIFVHDRQTGETTRVSVDSNGVEANNFSQSPFISSDGRYVAFMSTANNLVANDTNLGFDVFVHDRQTGETTRVSVDSNGVEGNEGGIYPSISSDGRYVAFFSNSDNLVANDTGGFSDVFVHDRQTGTTIRASVDSAGVQGNGHSGDLSICSDERCVAFSSGADNLVPNDTNGTADVFVHEFPVSDTGDGNGGGGGGG